MSRRPHASRAIALGMMAAVAVAGCSSTDDPDAPPRQDMPPESTPAPDATEGIDPELEKYYTQTLEWEDCGDEFQCSTLTVPLNYAEPDAGDIELSLLRVPASSDEPSGSLVVNPGGPGASGVDYARNAHVVASEQVLEQYDIVGFDPRGVGGSTPIECLDDSSLDEFLSDPPGDDDGSDDADSGDDGGEDTGAQDDADGSDDTGADDTGGEDSGGEDAGTDDGDADDTDDTAAAIAEQAEEFAQACESRSGELLEHIGTADVSRDLDVLRSALGDEALNYLGKSYGTLIGAVYADLFPERAGRLVLDGAIDPTLEAAEVALGQARGFERALDAYLDWCLDNDCPLGDTEEDARASLASLMAQTEEEPLPTGQESRPLTASLAFYGIILPLYLAPDQGYPTLSEALDKAVNEDDGSVLLQLADLYLNRNADGTYNGNQNEAIIAVNCLDYPEGTTVEEAQAALPQFEEASPIFGEYLAWSGLACSEWPAESDFDLSDIDGAGADPILVVGTTGDPATPYAWAESLADQLESGVLLTFDAFGHTAYMSGSDCVDEAVDDYLLNGTVPENDRTCS
ncbi:alpha/beta hydrolase [Phytoactinopolyspora halotolerans]|uniref:Alpha/beta hydrolase n=1 Tax=Phytoactinopolyspora halotolerans TaxID=1981512 RepID=A0A6L9S3R1_9ACTN|nr:alpha/beta hydrolase [Phytoactinopolyspora halotolerans]NED99067.1 alpha/beta hydrolase [Phytoactinopolyspora halotolerans]